MRWIASVFRMDEKTWERHANPLSAWSRFPILPLGVLLLLLRDTIGWALWIGLGLLALWTWLNPRAFPRPRRTDSWASRAVMGERVWLARGTVPIPRRHARWAMALAFLPVVGLGPMIWGIWQIDWALALTGTAVVLIAKIWFLDRMVWLFEDMAAGHPEYASWLRKDESESP